MHSLWVNCLCHFIKVFESILQMCRSLVRQGVLKLILSGYGEIAILLTDLRTLFGFYVTPLLFIFMTQDPILDPTLH